MRRTLTVQGGDTYLQQLSFRIPVSLPPGTAAFSGNKGVRRRCRSRKLCNTTQGGWSCAVVSDGELSCCDRPHARRIAIYALNADVSLERRNVTMSKGGPSRLGHHSSSVSRACLAPSDRHTRARQSGARQERSTCVDDQLSWRGAGLNTGEPDNLSTTSLGCSQPQHQQLWNRIEISLTACISTQDLCETPIPPSICKCTSKCCQHTLAASTSAASRNAPFLHGQGVQ